MNVHGSGKMSETESTDGIRFGRTFIDAVVGEVVDQAVQAIIYPANSRGVMGAGPASSVRFAGGLDVEREAMSHAPIDLGKAIVTTSGGLRDRGIEAVIHAVIAPGLGAVPRISTVVRAVDSALTVATEHRIHTLALPLIGISSEASSEERIPVVQALVDAIVKYIRRPATRIDRVVFACRFEDDRLLLQDAIALARQRSWSTPA